jgi:hypothetical protein
MQSKASLLAAFIAVSVNIGQRSTTLERPVGRRECFWAVEREFNWTRREGKGKRVFPFVLMVPEDADHAHVRWFVIL